MAVGRLANVRTQASTPTMQQAPGTASTQLMSVAEPGIARVKPNPVTAMDTLRAAIVRRKVQPAAADQTSDTMRLYDDLLAQDSAREGQIKEQGAFNQAAMQRQALAQAGRQSRSITGGGGAGLWAQAQIAGNAATQGALNDWWQGHQALALQALSAKTNEQRYQEEQSRQAQSALAQLDDKDLTRMAMNGNVDAQNLILSRYGKNGQDWASYTDGWDYQNGQWVRTNRNSSTGSSNIATVSQGSAGGRTGSGLSAPAMPGQTLDYNGNQYKVGDDGSYYRMYLGSWMKVQDPSTIASLNNQFKLGG